MAETPSSSQPAAGSPLPGVQQTVVVASGKGGVGKSTTAVNLALAMSRAGRRIGILDADVYGPSLSLMFGVREKCGELRGNKLVPIEKSGIRLMSMSFLTDLDRPMIWRGPMVHGAIQQLISQVDWGELDCLVIDLPPGTGDAQLSLAQILEISGAVIVTTPQDVSLIDARKGLMMFRQLKVPVLGIVENMSYFECPSCHVRTEIFRRGGGRRTAEELRVPFLGEIPLDPDVVLGGDEGRPIVAIRPESPAAAGYISLAEAVMQKLRQASEEKRIAQAPILPETFQWE